MDEEEIGSIRCLHCIQCSRTVTHANQYRRSTSSNDEEAVQRLCVLRWCKTPVYKNRDEATMSVWLS